MRPIILHRPDGYHVVSCLTLAYAEGFSRAYLLKHGALLRDQFGRALVDASRAADEQARDERAAHRARNAWEARAATEARDAAAHMARVV